MDLKLRQMPDLMHVCSTLFLNSCLTMFIQVSEAEAVKYVGKQLPNSQT